MVVGHGADGSGAAILRLMPADPTRDALGLSASTRCESRMSSSHADPALADTAAFCAAYGFDPDQSANTILVIGKSDPPRYAACVVLATTRLDVNRVVRDKLGTRKASFAPPDVTRDITGHEDRRRRRVRAAGRHADLGRRAGHGS